MDSSIIRQRLAEELVESGKYQQLQQLLRQELSKEGWYTKVDDLVNQEFLRAYKHGTTPGISSVTRAVEAPALGMTKFCSRDAILNV